MRPRTNESLETLQEKPSTSPHTSSDFKDFTNSLLEGERESFLNFAEGKAKNLPKPPELPQRWIEKNWEELAAQWRKSSGQAPKIEGTKWENHPQREEWLAEIEASGNPAMFADCEEKRNFIKWCFETKQYSWLKEEE